MTAGKAEGIEESSPNRGGGSGEHIPGSERKTSGLMSLSEFQMELARIDDVPSLQELNNRVAAMETYVRRMHEALEEQNRLGECRIRIARKIGDILRDTVRPGGKSKSHDATSIRGGSSAPLPKGITKSQSSRCQELAAIPEEHLVRYLRDAEAKGESVTVVGFLRAAKRYAGDRGPISPEPETAENYWERVWDAVTRTMEIDVAVGFPAFRFRGSRKLRPHTALQEELHGNVFVRTSRNVDAWLQKLAGGWQRGDITEAMILFPARTGQPWFRLLEAGGWLCCFLEKPDFVSAASVTSYLGRHTGEFWNAFDSMGAVLGAREP